MKKNMNKSALVEEVMKQTNLNEEESIIIVNIFEDNFNIIKDNRELIINGIVEKLNISNEDANNIYDITLNIIKTEIKRKITHPFGN